MYTLPFEILGHVKNDRLERTACLHKSFLQTEEKCYDTFYKLKGDFGKYKMGRTNVFDWDSKFKSGVTSVEHAEVSERPPTSKIDENVNRMQEFVLENRRITIREDADTLETSSESNHSISRQCKYAPDCRQIRPTC